MELQEFRFMLEQLVNDEIKRLGVNSPEFMDRHNEIMADIEKARHEPQRRGKYGSSKKN